MTTAQLKKYEALIEIGIISSPTLSYNDNEKAVSDRERFTKVLMNAHAQGLCPITPLEYHMMVSEGRRVRLWKQDPTCSNDLLPEPIRLPAHAHGKGHNGNDNGNGNGGNNNLKSYYLAETKGILHDHTIAIDSTISKHSVDSDKDKASSHNSMSSKSTQSNFSTVNSSISYSNRSAFGSDNESKSTESCCATSAWLTPHIDIVNLSRDQEAVEEKASIITTSKKSNHTAGEKEKLREVKRGSDESKNRNRECEDGKHDDSDDDTYHAYADKMKMEMHGKESECTRTYSSSTSSPSPSPSLSSCELNPLLSGHSSSMSAYEKFCAGRMYASPLSVVACPKCSNPRVRTEACEHCIHTSTSSSSSSTENSRWG